jgi:hypothetical protein
MKYLKSVGLILVIIVLGAGAVITTQSIKNQQQQQEIEQKGLLRYYLDKYLPYIVGGVVIYFALPTIKKTFTNEK